MNPLLLPGLLGTASAFVGMQVWHRGRARALLRQLGVRAAHAHEGRGKPLRPVGILPAPVARYLDLALGSRVAAPCLVILEQTGVLRTDTRSLRWWPFQATHTASPPCPGFLWNARVRLAPGLHLRVMDSLVEGIGAGEVLLLSALRVGHERGRPEMNAGALHRYLAEAPWYPWALLPSERLTWSGIDDSRAMATLVDGATTVSLEFRFGASGEVSGIYSPGRWGKFSDGFRQVPWEGRFEAYERHAGVLVPTQAAVGWYRGTSLELVWMGKYARFGWWSRHASRGHPPEALVRIPLCMSQRVGLTLRSHALALLWPQLGQRRLLTAAQMKKFPSGRLAQTCGIVTMRQRPSTSNGVVFVTLEDETGTVNVIVWRSLREQQRRELLHSRLLVVYGVWQREGEVCHLIARRLHDLTPLLGRLATESLDLN